MLQVVKRPARGSNQRVGTLPEFLVKIHQRSVLQNMMIEFLQSRQTETRVTNFNEVRFMVGNSLRNFSTLFTRRDYQADSSGTNVFPSVFQTENISLLLEKGADFWKRFPNALQIFLADEDISIYPKQVIPFD